MSSKFVEAPGVLTGIEADLAEYGIQADLGEIGVAVMVTVFTIGLVRSVLMAG